MAAVDFVGCLAYHFNVDTHAGQATLAGWRPPGGPGGSGRRREILPGQDAGRQAPGRLAADSVRQSL